MDKILYGLLGGAVSALGLGLIYEFFYNKKRLDAVKLELTNKMKTMDTQMTAVASAINTANIGLRVNYPTVFPASQSSPMDLEAAKQVYLSKIKNAVASVKAGDVKVYKSPTKQVNEDIVPDGVKMYKTTEESPIKVELTKVPQIVPEITSYKESK